MMTNLAQDIECGVLDPKCELQRLYPQQQPPKDQAAATATLYAHYAQERARSVNTQIPSDFWAGAEVLRAMAQFLREPLFVLEADANNDAHVQRYYYKTYTTAAGGTHETGCGGAMEDQEAKLMLSHYARLHVMPVMLVLKRHEGHFYGVHHGTLSTQWLAEGDRQFAESNCSTHTWFEEIIAHMDYSQGRMEDVDPMTDSEEVDIILIGGMEHHDRLDVIHERLGHQSLNADGFDIAHMEAFLGAEGDRLQAAAGPVPQQEALFADETYARNPHESAKCFPLPTHSRVALAQMQRILGSIGMDPELLPDRNKLRQLLQTNSDAVKAWCRVATAEARLGGLPDRQRDLQEMMPWLIAHRMELHSLFAYLPYPELAAKQLPKKTIQKWTELEDYDVKVQTIRTALHDPTSDGDTVEHCRAWLAACTLRGGDQQDRTVAGKRHRWARLQQLRPQTHYCGRPDHVKLELWNILQTLPFTVWAWRTTSMGMVPREHLGFHYSGHPAVHNLCELVAARGQWSAAALLPSGLTWDDRLTSMEAGLSARLRY
jgi:hypothetical protein